MVDNVRGARAAPAGAAGLILLVAAIETLIGGQSTGLMLVDALGSRFAAGAASTAAAGADVLALGDSVVKFGFDPAVAGRSLGGRAYNLGVPGMPAPVAEALLERVYAAGGRPSVVVIGFMALSGDPRDHLPAMAEAIGPRGSLRLGTEYRDASLATSMLLAHLVPSARHREGIRGLIRAKILGRAGVDRGPGKGAARRSLDAWTRSQGAELRRSRDPMGGRLGAKLADRVYSAPWPVDPTLVRSLGRISRLAQDRGARVFWLIPPLSPEAQARREALGLDVQQSRELLDVLDAMPGVVALDARRLGYPAEVFFDPIHLTGDGAARLTATVAEAVARPPSSRWVTLQQGPAATARAATSLPR